MKLLLAMSLLAAVAGMAFSAGSADAEPGTTRALEDLRGVQGTHSTNGSAYGPMTVAQIYAHGDTDADLLLFDSEKRSVWGANIKGLERGWLDGPLRIPAGYELRVVVNSNGGVAGYTYWGHCASPQPCAN